ncbi:synaptonemal complex protein 1 [Pyrus ussuriensis x Pyrus communis]|uniref:Synaptonemal complex protein 1 n=1 Tax=Pyrus ussuriensis x Pyrus communis TaxID=2448454 RepID=A0A5N5G0F9_9ROSA|nr:synaptonemal complex protein 1 [Pyrus ussuriensis x Pyrus communis]
MIDQLKDEKLTLDQELESVRGEVIHMKQHLQSAEQQVSDLSHNLKAKEEETLKVAEISTEIQQAQNVIQELTTASSQLKEKLGQSEVEYSTLSEMHELHELHEKKTLAQITGLEAAVAELELEMESLRAQKREMEVKIESTETEVKQLGKVNAGQEVRISDLSQYQTRERLSFLLSRKNMRIAITEIVELKDQIVEFEKRLTEKEGEFSSLQEKHDSAVNDASAQITAFVSLVTSLEQELDSLQDEKNQMELQFEREKQELSESLTKLENEKVDLESKIADHQRLLNEKEEICSKLKEECIQLESRFQDTKVNCDAAERKAEQVAEDFSKKIESKDEMIVDLEQEVEHLKRDLEEKGYELSSLVESSRNIEVKLRLSNQKLRVTEQVLTEKEESFKKAELKFLEEQRALEDRIARLSGVITANNEAYQRNITLVSENGNSSLSGIESVINKFVDNYAKYETCILETSQQLHIAKNWVAETNNEREKLKREVEDLIKQLRDKKEKAFILGEQVERMRAKASKEEVEKGSLIKAVSQLEKKAADLEKMVEEKKEGMLGLGEEKREAIRQLCIWIEYHQSRYDHLKEVLLKTTPARGQGRASSSQP